MEMLWIYIWSWLGAVAFFSFLEAVTLSLVSVWFAVGSLAATFAAYAGMSLTGQLLIFVGVSLAAMAAIRPIARRVVTPRFIPTNADRLVGSTGRVTETIDNAAASGAVYAGGKTWTARSSDGRVIAKDQTVEIAALEGVKVIVRPKAAVSVS